MKSGKKNRGLNKHIEITMKTMWKSTGIQAIQVKWKIVLILNV